MAKSEPTQIPLHEPDLDAAEIARRTAERDALLAKIAARPNDDALIRDPADVPVPLKSSRDLAAEIEHLKQIDYDQREQAERTFKEKIARLVQAQRAAEVREARQVDPEVRDRLRAATEAASGSIVDPREKVAERERAEVQAEVANAVKDARAALADLDEVYEEFKPELDRLSTISDTDWLRGLPAVGNDAHRAFSLARIVPEHVRDLNNYVTTSRRAIEHLIEDLKGVASRAPVPFAKDTALFMGWLAEFNGAKRDLGRMSGVAPTVASRITNLTGLVASLNELRVTYQHRPESQVGFQTENPTKVIRDLERESPHAPRPARAITENPEGFFGR